MRKTNNTNERLAIIMMFFFGGLKSCVSYVIRPTTGSTGLNSGTTTLQRTYFSSAARQQQQWRTFGSTSTTQLKNDQSKGNEGEGKKKKKPPRKQQEPNPYAATILLPETNFSQRANAIQREPELQAYWKSTNLVERLSQKAKDNGAPRFVLHDGPPYANGSLHIGHALNKILKDFINRQKVLKGYEVNFIPGWDCHGLPIELKVLQGIKSKTERQSLTPIELRQRAATFAKETVEQQSTSFQRYGVLGNWDKPYLTMQPSFEAAQIGVFGGMYKRGYIFRGRKPVHWSPSSRTALAEAELEYPENHVSKSIYVAFDITENPESGILNDVDGTCSLAVWTTTPWTMPANMAVAVNKQIEYSLVELQQNDGEKKHLIVATDLVSELESKFSSKEDDGETKKLTIVKSFKGSELIGTKYKHPMYDRTSPVVEGGDYITTESGTGLVHTAPGHGQEDYLTGLKYGLELLSPVDDDGKFTIEAGDEFVGKRVLGDGNDAVITKLTEVGALLKQEDYNHKYPYDWRTKKPTIFRATDQWFASVEGFREDAMNAIEQVKWVPDVGKNRITAFVSGRDDWCISRQRSWGVPIPVFYDRETGNEVLLNEETIEHIQDIFATKGSDAWWELEEVDLLPPKYKDEANKWRKGTDTMDVWFDSGSSWAGVIQQRQDEFGTDAIPADLYLEGSDQHRGWFQSSLLTSTAMNGPQAPYKTVLTHGFVLDEKGYKMSKSLGNVVDPMQVIEGGNNKKQQPAYGVDVLRLWVASVDYSGDVCIGDQILKQTFESYRKLRNTARYLIGNLADYVPEEHSIKYEDLPDLDKYMLGRLSSTMKTVQDAYENYQFYKATQELLRFANADLSNFYLDVAKDRLYTSAQNDVRRRTCQFVLEKCLMGLTKSIAPILPHMAEDIWQNLPFDKTDGDSVFEGGLPMELMDYTDTEENQQQWERIHDLRDDINKQLELARNDKLVGASLDAAVYISTTDEQLSNILTKLESDITITQPPTKNNGVDDLRTVLMISQVHLVSSSEDVRQKCDEAYVSDIKNDDKTTTTTIGVTKASGTKCARCWFYDERVGHIEGHSDLCERCADAVDQWKSSQEKVIAEEKVSAAAPA